MPSAARDITPHEVSKSLGASKSPPSRGFLPLGYGGAAPPSHTVTVQAAAKQLKPFNTQDIKILLLENVNKVGREALQKQGYQVEFLKGSLPENELIEKIR